MRTVSQSTPSLPFGEPVFVPESKGGNVRQKRIDAALEKANQAWRIAFEKFVLDFAAKAAEPFTAETIRNAYDATPGLPRTEKNQASGGIFQRLVREGKLIPRGMSRSTRFGNLLQQYTGGV